MSVTKQAVTNLFKQARSAFSGSLVTIRHANKEYSGTRIPFEQGEMVDEAGTIFTVTGGLRLLTDELAPVWPKAGDQIQEKVGNSTEWATYTIIATRLDETQATMLLTYGERYDQEGI